MPAARREITISGDYNVVNGSPVEDESHISTVVLLLSLRYGSCPVAPTLGNRIYAELGKLTDDAPRRAEHFARLALQPLTRRRAITELEVVAEEDTTRIGVLDLEVTFRDKDGSLRVVRFPISRGA